MKVLVTGMSGTGKSSALAELGHRAGALFDHVVLLSAPVDVLLARVATRTTTPYGTRLDRIAGS